MTVYIKAEDSVCIHNPDVKIKDVESIYCTDKDMEQKVKEAKLFHFKKRGNEREIISILKAVEVIKEIDKTAEVVNMGPEDFIVYLKEVTQEKKWAHYLKIAGVCLVAFFGASFSIMSYNTDVAIDDLFATVYQLVMGTPPKGPTILHLAYTAGLAIGIVIFFNHAGKIKLTDDPTPFEVQMRLYERDVNDTLMIDAGRKKEEQDVSS